MQDISFESPVAIVINGRTFSDLAEGRCAFLTVPKSKVNVQAGHGGNFVASQGRHDDYVLELRIKTHTADDKFLSDLYKKEKEDGAAFIFVKGSINKKGSGNYDLWKGRVRPHEPNGTGTSVFTLTFLEGESH